MIEMHLLRNSLQSVIVINCFKISVDFSAVEVQWSHTTSSCLSLRRSPHLSWFHSRPRQTAVSLSESAPGLFSLSNNGREKSFMENCSTLHNYSTLSATICHPQKSLSDKWLVSLLQYHFNNKGSLQSLSSNYRFLLYKIILLCVSAVSYSYKDDTNTCTTQNLNNDFNS